MPEFFAHFRSSVEHCDIDMRNAGLDSEASKLSTANVISRYQCFETISVFVYICPPHCERNSAHIVRTFPSSFRCVFDIVAHNVVGKSKILQYVGVRSFSQFLIIFIVHSIQFFIVSSKISKFLKLDQN